MSSGYRKAAGLLALAVLGSQAAHAHSAKDAIPMLAAMPLGQALACVVLVYFAIRLKYGKSSTVAIGCSWFITSVLVWISGFPFLGFLLLLAPAALWSALVLFGFYGFLTSLLGGTLGGWLFRHLALQHKQSFGATRE